MRAVRVWRIFAGICPHTLCDAADCFEAFITRVIAEFYTQNKCIRGVYCLENLSVKKAAIIQPL